MIPNTQTLVSNVKRNLQFGVLFIGLFLAPPLTAEGLSGQLTLGQRIQHSSASGGIKPSDKEVSLRTDLGFKLTSQTRSQKLSFQTGIGLSYNLHNNSQLKRVQFKEPHARLNYTLERRGSKLTFGASYMRADFDKTAFTHDVTNSQDILTGTGQRETYAVQAGLKLGREAKVMLDLDFHYKRTNYLNTINPNLVTNHTQGVSGRLSFKLNPRVSGYAFGSFNDRDANTTGSHDRTTHRIGIGASYSITPTLTFTTEISRSKVETNDNAGLITETSDGGYHFKIERKRHNTALFVDLKRQETINGKRQQASIGMHHKFKHGTLKFSLGVAKTNGLSAQPLANIKLHYKVGKTDYLKLEISQTSLTTNSNEAAINSRLGLSYRHTLSPPSTLTASLHIIDQNVITASAQDQRSIQVKLAHRYNIGSQWDLVSGYNFSRTIHGTQSAHKSSTVFIGFEKAFDFRP